MGIRGGETMDFDPRLVDNRIQEILDKRGMTQKELARILRTHYKVKVYQSDISEIINGRVKNLTLIRAAAFSLALGYSVEAVWPSLFK